MAEKSKDYELNSTDPSCDRFMLHRIWIFFCWYEEFHADVEHARKADSPFSDSRKILFY